MATQRLRIFFAKEGPLRYCSHLDLVRVWERTLRRAELPLMYSCGFNPRPKLQLASALPLGHTGEAEILDVWLEQSVEPNAVQHALRNVLPEGLRVTTVEAVPTKAPALQTQILSTEYEVTVEWPETRSEVERRVVRLLEATEWPVLHRGQQINLRPLVEELSVIWAGEGRVKLHMQLAARASATARPEMVLEALGMGNTFADYHRVRLIGSSDILAEHTPGEEKWTSGLSGQNSNTSGAR